MGEAQVASSAPVEPGTETELGQQEGQQQQQQAPHEPGHKASRSLLEQEPDQTIGLINIAREKGLKESLGRHPGGEELAQSIFLRVAEENNKLAIKYAKPVARLPEGCLCTLVCLLCQHVILILRSPDQVPLSKDGSLPGPAVVLDLHRFKKHLQSALHTKSVVPERKLERPTNNSIIKVLAKMAESPPPLSACDACRAPLGNDRKVFCHPLRPPTPLCDMCIERLVSQAGVPREAFRLASQVGAMVFSRSEMEEAQKAAEGVGPSPLHGCFFHPHQNVNPRGKKVPLCVLCQLALAQSQRPWSSLSQGRGAPPAARPPAPARAAPSSFPAPNPLPKHLLAELPAPVFDDELHLSFDGVFGFPNLGNSCFAGSSLALLSSSTALLGQIIHAAVNEQRNLPKASHRATIVSDYQNRLWLVSESIGDKTAVVTPENYEDREVSRYRADNFDKPSAGHRNWLRRSPPWSTTPERGGGRASRRSWKPCHSPREFIA